MIVTKTSKVTVVSNIDHCPVCGNRLELEYGFISNGFGTYTTCTTDKCPLKYSVFTFVSDQCEDCDMEY